MPPRKDAKKPAGRKDCLKNKSEAPPAPLRSSARLQKRKELSDSTVTVPVPKASTKRRREDQEDAPKKKKQRVCDPVDVIMDEEIPQDIPKTWKPYTGPQVLIEFPWARPDYDTFDSIVDLDALPPGIRWPGPVSKGLRRRALVPQDQDDMSSEDGGSDEDSDMNMEVDEASQQRTKEIKEQRELLLASSTTPGSSSSGRVPARPIASSSSQLTSVRQVASSSGRVRDTAQKQKSQAITPVTDGSAAAAVFQTDHQSLLHSTGNHSHQIGFSYHHNDGAWQAQGAPMFYPPGSNIHYGHGAEVPRQSLTPGTSFEMQDRNMGTYMNAYLANYNPDASQYYYQ